MIKTRTITIEMISGKMMMTIMMHCKCAGKGEGSSIGEVALEKRESPPNIQVSFGMVWKGVV